MAGISSFPRSVRAYSTLGGVVGCTARDRTPRFARSFNRALSSLAEINGIARRSSEKRRDPSLRFQMISGVQTPPSRLMQDDIQHPSGGATFFLSFNTMTRSWSPTATRFLNGYPKAPVTASYPVSTRSAPAYKGATFQPETPMKLFYTAGTCSLSPHIVLRELGLPFTLEAVDIKTKTTASGADFMKINHKGCVPALQLEDGEVLTEGSAIIQYLADKYAPGKLAPATGTVDRARLDGHLNFISSELHKAFAPLFNPTLTPEAREAALANLNRKLDMTEQTFTDGRDYLTGSEFSLADAYLFVVLSWAKFLGVDLVRQPNLVAFQQRVFARSAVQAAMTAEGLLQAA